MKRVLVAGKGSYIGQSLIRFAQENDLGCEITELDVQNPSWKDADFSGFESVVLVAGIAHQKETDVNRHLYYEVNRDLAYEIARTSKAAGIHHFVMLSTMSVYGVDEGVITPETEPCPSTSYGKSKLQGEELVASLSDETFGVAILRPPMVYGPNCKGNFNSLVKLAMSLPVFPKVENKRSAIYIDNLCSFIIMCVSEGLTGLYFPQDDRYLNTSHAASVIAEAVGRRSRQSTLLGMAVIASKSVLRIARKAFGTLIYSETENFGFSYCTVEQNTALRRSAVSSDMSANNVCASINES